MLYSLLNSKVSRKLSILQLWIFVLNNFKVVKSLKIPLIDQKLNTLCTK